MSDPQHETESVDKTNPSSESSGQGAVDEVFGEGSGMASLPLQELERLRDDARLANERVLRAQADLENFRKRTRRDYEDQLKYAQVPLIRDLLGGMDNLRRAIASAANHEHAASLRDGVEMVLKQFEGVLAKHHCRPIPAVGEAFDPNYHEALTQIPSNDQPAGFVVQEVTVGYQIEDRVIRPSQVIVSTGPVPAN